MKRILFALIVLSGTLQAQQFHVTAIRRLQPTDPEPVTRAFRVSVVTGTMDGKKYITQQTMVWGSQALEVGKDYEVAKADARTIIVITHDKKGRDDKERLNIVSVEEGD